MRSRSTKIRNLTKLMLVVVLFIGCDSTVPEIDFKKQQGERVKEEKIGYSGVTILTIDNHEYIHYRDGNNAASVGGICHKEDCSFCLAEKQNKITLPAIAEQYD